MQKRDRGMEQDKGGDLREVATSDGWRALITSAPLSEHLKFRINKKTTTLFVR